VPKDSAEIAASAAEIRAHMTVLADDLYEGREAGTRGDALAQLYIASRMAAVGLQPAGDRGGFVRTFRIRATKLIPNTVSFTITGPAGAKDFTNGAEVAVFGDPLEPQQKIDDAALVFAGYGISAPERGIDDYAGLDVRGKVAVVLGGPPPFLPAAEAAHYGSADQQRLAAERAGAIGVVQLWTPAYEARFPWTAMSSLLGRTDMTWIGAGGIAHVIAPGIRLRAFAHGAASDALLAGSGRALARLLAEARTHSPKGFALPSRLSFGRRSSHDDSRRSGNVAGLLVGSDAKLRDEVVVLTAHYDHVGIGPPVAGDAIYNGALDNASGTAGLLEVARLMAAAPQRPKRSVLFLAVGAEEKGLVGSDYFAAHPDGPAAKIVANINLDGMMPFYDFSDVIAFGAEHSQMGERLATAAAQLGLKVAPDPFPEEGIFTRSDQYSFVKRGVPSVFLYVGFSDMAGRSVGRKHWDANARFIHQPNDDLTLPIDYAVAAKFTELFRRLVIVTANTPERPLWYRSSSFGSEFAPNAPKAARR
jgi:Zn-dependent M28 family amino/carboxypeptidase